MVPPERLARRTHLDSSDGGSGDGGRKNGISGGSSTGRDNDLQCRWRSPLPSLSSWGGDCGRDDDDGGRKGGARRRRGDGEATARRRQGDGEATTRQRQGSKDAKAIGYGAAGGRGNKAIDKRITNNRT